MDPAAASADDGELGEAIARYLELERGGEQPTIEAFVRQYPALGPALRACLEVLARMPGSDTGAVQAPRTFGDFRLLRPIGRGGMGVVYEAEQISLPRRVAIKVLAPGGDAERAARFRREVITTAKLRHPNIVPVLEAGACDGVPYYAMPLLDGESLDRVLARMRAEGARALLESRGELVTWLARFIEVARALDLAHQAGVLHRDIKPSNLFLERSGRLVVLDFGLTRSSGASSTTLTASPVGTPRYMSPEQILVGKLEVDGRSDLFALAATMYELVLLEPAFAGDDRESVFHSILAVDPRPPRAIDPRLPRDVEVVLLQALEKEPARRYASCAEFAADLQRFLDYEPVRARPVGLLGTLARRARRNPAAAAALTLALLSMIVLPLRAGLQARERARSMVAAEIAAVRANAGKLIELRERIRALDLAVSEQGAKLAPWSQSQAKEPWLAVQRELHAAERERDDAWREVVVHTAAATRIAPAEDEARREFIAAAFADFCDAEERRDAARMDWLRELALSHGGADATAGWRGFGAVELSSDPPGARVHLFRLEDKDSLRLPVPVSGAGEIDQAFFAAADTRGPWLWLRVTRAGPAGAPLHAGDELLDVCGEPARDAALVAAHLAHAHADKPSQEHFVDLRRAGRLATVMTEPRCLLELAGELESRPVFPLERGALNDVGPTPVRLEALPVGNYAALLELDDFAVRVPLEIRRGCRWQSEISFFEATALDDDFVYIPAGPVPLGGDPRALDPFAEGEVELPAFFIQRRELSFGAYFDFLHALDARDREQAEQRAPRQRPGWGPLWSRDASDRIVPRLPWQMDRHWPVVGVSYRDAEAYCAWLNETSGRGDVRYALPTEQEWEKAARGVDRRACTWGDGFEWSFARLSKAAEITGLLPAEAYATDESIYGVRDLNGNVREWCDGPAELATRLLRGGAWLTPTENEARVASRGVAVSRDHVDTASGFRLVARLVGSGR